jgi:chromosomal replication initiation ATPase DnaA
MVIQRVYFFHDNPKKTRQIETIYLLRQVRDESLNNISELFNIKAYSTVSSILRSVSRLKKSDRKIKKQVNEIQDSVTKGQK